MMDVLPCRCGAGVLLALAVYLTGCQHSTSDKDLVFIGPDEVGTLMAGEKKLLGLAGRKSAALVDPRAPRDFVAGHIPGAVNIPYRELNRESARLEGYDTIMVYGADYDSPLAFGMSKSLLEMGFSDVRTLRGGLRAWENAGNPVEQEPGGDDDAGDEKGSG